MRPLERWLIRSAHTNAPSESGIGRLPATESLYSDLSCCARETHGIAIVPAAAAPSHTVRRVVLFMGIFLRGFLIQWLMGGCLGCITAGRTGQGPLRFSLGPSRHSRPSRARGAPPPPAVAQTVWECVAP